MVCKTCGWKFLKVLDKQVQIWRAADIVSKICTQCLRTVPGGKYSSNILVNPGNVNFEGTQRSYFPIGGPLPVQELATSVSWGGMDAGSNMLYPTQCIDGRVHQEGGKAIAFELRRVTGEKRFQVGSAVVTAATERLKSVHGFSHIVHVAVPLESDICRASNADDDDVYVSRLLQTCYRASFEALQDNSLKELPYSISVPLIGSGAGGFKIELSAASAVDAIMDLKRNMELDPDSLVRLVANSDEAADTWIECFKHAR